jgi:error-prone DNA polymerase
MTGHAAQGAVVGFGVDPPQARVPGIGQARLRCPDAGVAYLDARGLEGVWGDAAAVARAALGALGALDGLGLVAHARACQEVGITLIAGAELTLADGSHLTLLARDGQGYQSLSSLLSQAHLAGEKDAPSLGLEGLAPYALGLECLTGCRKGPVAATLLGGDREAAGAALDRLRAIFGAGHTWVEMQRGGLPDDNRLCYELAQLARRAGLPQVATGNTHYACAEERDLQDVLVCLRHRLPLTQARPHLRSGAPWCLPCPARMARRFAEYPSAIRGTLDLAERCGFDLTHIDTAFPTFPAPAGQTSISYLRSLVLDGARERYGDPLAHPVRRRLEHELALTDIPVALAADAATHRLFLLSAGHSVPASADSWLPFVRWLRQALPGLPFPLPSTAGAGGTLTVLDTTRL